jgi:hypothetical protein
MMFYAVAGCFVSTPLQIYMHTLTSKICNGALQEKEKARIDLSHCPSLWRRKVLQFALLVLSNRHPEQAKTSLPFTNREVFARRRMVAGRRFGALRSFYSLRVGHSPLKYSCSSHFKAGLSSNPIIS